NLTSTVSSGVIKYGLKDTLTGINSISNTSTKSKITLEDNSLKLTHDGASVTIAKDEDKAKISGLKDFDVNSSDYGKENSGIAATQKEVKDVLNKINANGTEQDKLKNGTLGTVVYTDKDGNKLMKDTDGKFYKAKENGQKEDNAQEIKKENIILSTVNSDGKTTEPITLGNVASALGLSKDKKDKDNEILNKLVNKEAKKDVYNDAELNKVVTLRDLQFLASKGITFAGSTGTATKFLGDTITINGSNSTDLTKDNFATKYETKNIAVKVDNTNGNIEVGLAKELSKINSITSEEDTNDKTKTKITLSKDGATFGVEKDVTSGNNTTTQQVGVKTTIGKDGISVTKQGEQNPSVSIKESSIDFATTSADNKTVGTGSITGLKDLDDNSDGHMAANKNYVDKKFDDVANKVVNINKQVNKNINGIKQNSQDIKSLGEQIKTVEKLSKAPIKFGTNSGYVDKKLGDAIKIKGTGTVTKKYDEEYNSNNIATKTDEKGNIVIGISKELKDMKSFETEQDKTTGNSSKLDQNGLTITDKNGAKENPRHTVEITKDKIVFKKEYKDGNKDNVENGIVIDNKSNTITGIKTKDTDKGDTVVSKQYVDDKLNQKPFGYFVKNTVFGSDGKEYSKDTVEVDGKRFEGTDKVIKGENNNYYKEKDIKGRKYDSKTHLWSGADIQPKPVDEAKPLNSTNLVRGKDGKFYNPIDLEDAIYDKDSNKYKKNGADVTGGKEANDVVIKALPNIKPMALSNIGDGRMIANSTDAVNGGQVFEALKGKLDKDGSNIEQKSFATNASKGADLSKPEDILVTDKQVSEHLKNNYYNKTQVNNMISTIDNKSTVALEKSELALGGVANAVAMANLVQVNSYSDYRHNLSAAYGYYGGSHALAVGFSGTNEERNFVYKLSGSVNNKGNLALGVGAGVMLGDVDEYNINKLNVKKVTKKLEFANEKIEKYEKRQQETDKKIKELSEYKENSEKRIQELEKKLERLIKNK
ncbi:YadA-like family protein, partial [uncultured Sneathia sp.]|uniref:YadA-like family protein n=1 Tax=uncultured Sneathia sp. TaxID=278067 RepID=UPI002805F709